MITLQLLGVWSVCAQHQGFSSKPLLPPKARRLGLAKRWGENTAGTAGSSWPYHMMLWSAIKDEGKDKDMGIFMTVAFVFPNSCYTCWGPAFLELAGYLVLMVSIKWIPCFALITCKDFACLIKLPLSCSMTLCTFLLYSPHTVGEGSEQAG